MRARLLLVIFAAVFMLGLFAPSANLVHAAPAATPGTYVTGCGGDPSTPGNLTDLLQCGFVKYKISGNCMALGQCSVSDIVQLFLNAATVIFGISGSFFILTFVIGGFTWLTSAGASGGLQKGLNIMRDAVVGLIIIFAAYIIVNSTLSLVTKGTLPDNGTNLEGTLNNITGSSTIQIKTKN